MKMKEAILWIMVFGVMFSGLSITSVSVSPEPMLPGGYGAISATIGSTMTVSATGSVISGGQDIERIKITVTSYSDAVQITNNEIDVGTLDAGASILISIPVKIAKNAESGSYLVKITAEGWVENSEGGTNYNEKSATLVVDVLNSPLISLQTNQDTIEEKGEITLNIINDGGDAKNLRLDVSDGFAIEGKDQIYVGDVDKEANVTFVLDATAADAGPNDVEFSLHYYDELGNEKNDSKTIRLNIVKEESIVNIIQNSEMTSNTETVLNLTIKNKGKTIEDLKISFPDADLKLKESDKIEIGTLGSNEEKKISVAVFPVLNPGLNQVETLVEWKENGEEKSDTIKVPFTVSSDVTVGIYLEAKPTPLYSGEEHTLVVLVSNLGSYKISNVDVSASGKNFDLLDVQASEYIGEMNNDDFSTVQFKIRPKHSGVQNITLTVKYKDQSGEWMTETINKEVIVYDKPVDLSSIYQIIVLLAIVGLAYWYFKLRKKTKTG